MRILLPLAIATNLLAVAAPAATPAPRVKLQSFEQLKQPLPLPYDEQGVGLPAVDKARARAKASGKLLLIDLGGNWCLDCRILAGTMELPDVAPWVRRHYEVVTVNVGRFDKNLDVPARYGITQRLEGVPSLLIVDPKSNRLLNAGRTAALADARHMSPQGLADYLATFAR